MASDEYVDEDDHLCSDPGCPCQAIALELVTQERDALLADRDGLFAERDEARAEVERLRADHQVASVEAAVLQSRVSELRCSINEIHDACDYNPDCGIPFVAWLRAALAAKEAGDGK